MKVTDILNESMEWNNPDGEQYMSLQGLVNRNNGVFKSVKQRDFILNRWASDILDGPEAELRFKNFGTPVNAGNRTVQPSGYYRWAEYGARSIVPFLYVFELDEFGVVRKWKVGYKGNMRMGAAPDPKKAKLEFERPANVDTSHLHVEKTDAEKKVEFIKGIGGSVGKYVGEVGKRMSFGPVTLKKRVDLGYRPAGPYGEAQTWMNIYHDADGNIIYHTTASGSPMEEGETMNMVGMVKKHMVNKRQEKITIVNRPKFTPVKALGEDAFDTGDEFTPRQVSFLESYLSSLLNDAVEVMQIHKTREEAHGIPIYQVFITYDGKDDKGYRGSIELTMRPEGDRLVDIYVYNLRGAGYRMRDEIEFDDIEHRRFAE
jgi:hypothetical protein